MLLPEPVPPRPVPDRPPFITAEWRHLAMLNWQVHPDDLQEWLPAGTELDFFQGRCYLSLVAFLFLNTRVRGIAIPFHRDFEEVNLRFYVRRLTPEGYRRGVVFLRELVPRPVIAWVARLLYHENYLSSPMSHELEIDAFGMLRKAEYRWQSQKAHQCLKLELAGQMRPVESGSLEQFIAEHYWGYTALRDGCTMEYQVEHPSWQIQQVKQFQVEVDFENLAPPKIAAKLRQNPDSVFLAGGSEVKVYPGQRLVDRNSGCQPQFLQA
jgi:uncharacterized protein